MSAIAGIVHFDGSPADPASLQKMCFAMARRGPDGMAQWVEGAAGLGFCMLRTTPESLDETQPLANEDGDLVLVMDGRVDNREDLRRELSSRGAVLRDDTDAELVLKAYATWGEACPDRIIGEFAFFIWDARRRQLFGARDAAGTRHFYYHEGNNWFSFASEIKGLLSLGRIEPKLNESRLVDYLAPEFDRDDQVGTFYQDIKRLPAGSAIKVTSLGVRNWRYWDPSHLVENRFSSLEECAEAFLDCLRTAVGSRMRHIGPVGAMLSGGLDSSSIVALVSKEFRGHLESPLRTFSLILDDRENCLDWPSIRSILEADDWLDPTVVTADLSDEACRNFLEEVSHADEPFEATHGLISHVLYGAARAKGCRAVFEGMAGDLHFYGDDRSRDAVFHRRLYSHLPAIIAACVRHDGYADTIRRTTYQFVTAHAPEQLRGLYRRARDRLAFSGDDAGNFYTDATRRLIKQRREDRFLHALKPTSSDQAIHARYFISGLLSFPHEVYGQIALSKGVEPRSPFSDRRLIEFSIAMPLEAKIYAHWYKRLLRMSMRGLLPEEVRWRQGLSGHPGWRFHQMLFEKAVDLSPEICDLRASHLAKWITLGKHADAVSYGHLFQRFRLGILGAWLKERGFVEG